MPSKWRQDLAEGEYYFSKEDVFIFIKQIWKINTIKGTQKESQYNLHTIKSTHRLNC